MDAIRIENAAENNLQGVSVAIPRRRLTVVTGVSGSGKSTLAYNIVYAEGQRRYLESLAPYARQFLHLFQKPRVDWIDGLAPALSLQQNAGATAALSTLGTTSEVYDYLRLLFYSCAGPHCPACAEPLVSLPPDGLAAMIGRDFAGQDVAVYAPLIRDRKGHYRALLAELARRGVSRVRVDGKVRSPAGAALARHQRHTIEALAGTAPAGRGGRRALKGILAEALCTGRGELTAVGAAGDARFYSMRNFCHSCGRAYPDPQPATFSFHSLRHRCGACDGTGTVGHVPPELLFPDPTRPLGRLEPVLDDGALQRRLGRAWHRALAALDLSPLARWTDLPASSRDALLTENHTEPDEDHPANLLLAHRRELPAAEQRDFTLQYLREKPCPACGGCRLAAAGRAYRLGGAGVADLVELPLDKLSDWLGGQAAGLSRRFPQAEVIAREMDRRLRTMMRIGLDYLTLNRSTDSLSGGELQRLRLAARLQNAMGGVLYVLDEPSIGLHPADFEPLMELLREIRDQGNTLLVVEHDASTIRGADHVVDLGPGGGAGGGRLLYSGPTAGLTDCAESVTAAYLSGRTRVRLPARRRAIGRNGIALAGVRTHNLKDIRAFFPFAALTVVTGVSGSGKSSLVADTLYPLLRAQAQGRPARHPDVDQFQLRGGEVDHVYFVDQSPVGRTPRSTPATYTGLFDEIRRFFARLPEAQARGLTASHFSYNTGGGRCAACGGMGQIRMEMKFLPDSFVPCGQCQGRRYAWDVLRVRYQGRSIADVLDLSIVEALDLFRNFPALRRRLQVLADTGMGYIRLGQPTPTLSGGEQQRLKLGAHLLDTRLRRTVFLLDEPTTGLHFADIDTLCVLIHHLVDAGNTVIAIEHNLDFIAQADYVIDLGPGSGAAGGEIVYGGPLEGLAGAARSATGPYLRRHLDSDCTPPVNSADYGAWTTDPP